MGPPVFSENSFSPSPAHFSNTVTVRLFSLFNPRKIIIKPLSSTFQSTITLRDHHKTTFRTSEELTLSFHSNLSITVYSDKALIHRGSWKSVVIKSGDQSPISVANEIIQPRPYHGSLLITKRQMTPAGTPGIFFINKVPFRHYLASVVSSEMGVLSKSIESLKAQAIVSRSFARHYPGRHSNNGHDFCDSTHCQVYLGAKLVTPAIEKSVSDTEDILITHRGEVIPTYFHSTCGGHTTSLAGAWGDSSRPYIVGVRDSGSSGTSYCRESPHYSWTTKIPLKTLFHHLWREGSTFGGLKTIHWDYDSTGRVLWVRLRRAMATKVLSGESFRLAIGRRLGWNVIKSARFTTKLLGDTVLFRGHGLGHGIGLCQYGAIKMGILGKTHREILEHYFPKTVIARHP
ncbi:MAG: SpoIID/LytB domain-containing protein [Spirochaetota bacterium]|nr:SpoIID/LytB domain-containing protein [Spirochaetota bacterium]